MSDRNSDRDRNPGGDWVLSTALVLLWLGLAIAPRSLGPLVANVLGLALLAPLVIWGVWTGFDWRQVRLVALSGAVLLLLLVVATLRAANPRVAAAGLVYQHSGLLLWVGVIGWLIVAMGASSARAQRRAVQTVSMLGAVAVFAWALDRLGLLWDTARYSAMASGILENSLSLNQVVLLSLGCTIAWCWSEWPNGVKARWILGGSAVAQSAVVLLSAALGSYLGLACGVLFAAAVLWRAPGKGLSFRSGACVAGGLIAAALLFLGAAARSAALFDLVNRIGTDRMTTWRNALDEIDRDIVLGRGPDLFSSIVRWDIDPTGRLDYLVTNDPHNLLLYVLLSVGVVGFVCACAFALLVAKKVADANRELRTPPTWLVPIMAGVVAWLVSLLTSWVTPIAGFTAAVLVGTAASRRREPREGRRVAAALAAAAIISCVAVGLVCLNPAISSEWRYHRAASVNVEAADGVDQSLGLFDRWRDPSLLSTAARILDEQGGGYAIGSSKSGSAEAEQRWLAQVDRLKSSAESDSTWDARLPILVLKNLRWQSLITGRDLWSEEQAVLARGRAADPNTSFWNLFAAVEAQRLGKSDEAAKAAEAALAKRPPASVVPLLESIKAGG